MGIDFSRAGSAASRSLATKQSSADEDRRRQGGRYRRAAGKGDAAPPFDPQLLAPMSEHWTQAGVARESRLRGDRERGIAR